MIVASLILESNQENVVATLSVDSGYTLTEAVIWSSEDYKITLGDDISTLIVGDTVTIPITDLPNGIFSGLYVIEFMATDGSNEVTCKGVIANLAPTYECFLQRVLTTDLKNCEEISYSNCPECDNNVPYLNILLLALDMALSLNDIDSAAIIMNQLNEVCTSCTNCLSYDDTTITDLTTVVTINNNIYRMQWEMPN